MPYADTLKIFEHLRPKFDEEKAKVIAEAIETALETNNDTVVEKLEKFATKADLEKIRAELVETKAEIIKWMFIFLVGQFFAIITTIFTFLKLKT